MTYNLSVCRQALRFICYSANHVNSHMADWVGLSKHDPCRDMLPDVGLVFNCLENWIKSGKYSEIKGQF